MERRHFALAASSALSAQRVVGANDRLRGAIIGAGGRGRYLTAEFKEIGVEMGAVCDVYEGNLALGLKAASTGAKPFDNYRKLLGEKDLDVVIVATPDHWHAQMTIDAVEAGKDVYVEKPMAHKIDEGFKMIDATRRTKRIVQVGTQRRSYDVFQEAKKIMDSGVVGEVQLVNSWWYNYTGTPGEPKLDGKVDWKQWLGTAPSRDFDPLRFRNWYWYWDYSGGLLVGQAAHVMDSIMWFLNSKYPLAVSAAGNRTQAKQWEVPETATMLVEFPENYMAVFSLGYKSMRYNAFHDQMKQFNGRKARFDVSRESWALYPESNAIDPKPTQEMRKPGSFGAAARAHIRNFLECVKSRNEPNAPVEAGQACNIVMCMAMDSLRQGRRLKWNNTARKVETA